MSELQELVRKLAKARQMTEIAETEVDWTKKEISESELGLKLAEEQEIVRLAKGDEAEARAELELAVLANFDGDKHPLPAITIKDYTIYEYPIELAVAWAQHNLPGALKLDARVFEKGIAAVGAPQFVSVQTEHRVTVASDLSGYLE